MVKSSSTRPRFNISFNVFFQLGAISECMQCYTELQYILYVTVFLAFLFKLGTCSDPSRDNRVYAETSDGNNEGSVATYKCVNERYSIKGLNPTKQCRDGSWEPKTQPLPKCYKNSKSTCYFITGYFYLLAKL